MTELWKRRASERGELLVPLEALKGKLLAADIRLEQARQRLQHPVRRRPGKSRARSARSDEEPFVQAA